VRERRVIPGYSLLLVCVLPLPSAHEAAGATGIRRSPRPLWAWLFDELCRIFRWLAPACPYGVPEVGRVSL